MTSLRLLGVLNALCRGDAARNADAAGKNAQATPGRGGERLEEWGVRRRL